MKKLLDTMKTKKKFIFILIAIVGVIVYMSMPMSNEKKNALITQKISQKQYKDAYDFNNKYYDSSSNLYKSNYEKINKCESMGVTTVDEYNKIAKNIEIGDKKIKHSNGSYDIVLKCKNNNKINLKDVQINVKLKNRENKNDEISTNITIESAMKSDGGEAIVRGKIDNAKNDNYAYDSFSVISCGSKLKDSEVDKNTKKDESVGEYMKNYQDLINKIQTRIPEIKVSSLYGDEFGKDLTVEVKLQHNLNSTYEIIAKLPVLFETDLKEAEITSITATILKENGDVEGLIISKLSDGTYKPTLNTCQ